MAKVVNKSYPEHLGMFHLGFQNSLKNFSHLNIQGDTDLAPLKAWPAKNGKNPLQERRKNKPTNKKRGNQMLYSSPHQNPWENGQK